MQIEYFNVIAYFFSMVVITLAGIYQRKNNCYFTDHDLFTMLVLGVIPILNLPIAGGIILYVFSKRIVNRGKKDWL